jgi:hypothetical protein
MPEFDKNLKPILLNEDSNPLNLPNPSVPTPNNYGSLGGRRDGGGNDDMVRQFFGNGPIISPMLPTVSAKELYDNRRYGKYSARIQNIEDQKAYAQSAWDQAANGILKGANLAATTVAGGFGTLVGAAKAVLPGGKLSDIWDNEVTRSLQEWNDEVDQYYLPNYYTDKQKNASWYSPDNWFSANWLFDKLVKNSGYAVGAMLGGNIANAGLLRAGSFLGRVSAGGAVAAESSQAFKLFTPLLRNMSRAFSAGKNKETAAILEKELSSIADLTSTASRIGELSKQTNAFARFSDAGRRSAVSLYSAAGESSFEALSTANQFRDNLIEKYKENHFGEEPEGEELEKINQAAEKIGKTSFLGNMALLTVTEFQQLPYLLGSSYNASRQAANSLAGRVDDVLMKDSKYLAAPKSTTRFGKLYDKVAGVGRYVFDPKEAAQEIGQYALQVGTQNYFNKAFQTNNADAWVDGFLYGFIGKDEKGEGVGALVSDEGIESGILGGITGGLMQARGTYLESRSKTANTQIFLDQLNGAPSFKKAFVDRKNAINRGVILQEQQQNAVLNGDELEAKDLGYDSMHNYLAPRVKYGRYDMVKDEIQDMRLQASTDEGFSVLQEQGLAGIGDDKLSFIEKLNEFERSADYVNELYKSLTLRYSGILDSDGKRKYSSNIIDKMVYAAGKIANYDVRIPAENLKLTAAGVTNIPEILESIIKDFQPNKVAVEGALKQINDMVNLLSEDRDSLKSSLSSLIEMSLRRKLFMDEYDAIKAKPEDFDETPEYAYGETEELPITVKQIGVPEGKKRKKELEKGLEVGKTYSLEVPFLRKGNNITVGPKMKVMSQTLGGEFEVLMPDGQIKFLTAEDFKNYTVSEFDPVTPKLSEIFDNAIDSVLNRKKYDGLDKPTENRLEYINSLNNKELIDDVEKEFAKRSAEYLKDLKNERLRYEAMKKHSSEIQKDQEEIEKTSAEPPTGADDFDEAVAGDWEDMKKAAARLFPSTTTISEDWGAGNIPAHVTTFIQFTNNQKKLKKRFDMRVMLVTSAQQKLFGLDGLAEMSFGDKADKSLIVTKEQYDAIKDEDEKKRISNDGFVGAVVIKVDNKGNKFFIDKDGNSIGKVGEIDPATGQVRQIDLGKVVFSTMPTPGLYNSRKQAKYRIAEKEEAEAYSKAWSEYRKNLYDANPNQLLEFDFGVSKGISVKKTDVLERNFVDQVLLDDPKRMETEQFLQVSTKGEIAHEDGNNYKVPVGRPVFKNADDLAYLNNNKFSKKRAQTIFAVLKELSNRANKRIVSGETVTIKFPELTDFLRDVMFWYTKSTTTPSANKLYIDSNNMLHIGRTEEGKVVENVYDFANIEKFENEVVRDLMSSYHNVNNKTLTAGVGKTFTELYLDDKNTLQKRVWPNYQAFLISSTLPDGTKRSVDDTPLFTRIAQPTPSVPYPFKQKYVFLLGLNLPKTEQKKPEAKKEEKKVEYVFDGTTVNKYDRKDFIDLGGVYEFTAKNVTSVETAPTEANNELIEKINKNDALKKKMRQIILDIKKVDGTSVFKKESVDALGNDVDFVEVALPIVVGSHLNKLQKAAAEKPPVKDVISDEVYNNFVDKNIVPDEILNSIAEKVMNRTSLSERENAIFTGKTAEINEIIKKRSAPVFDVEARKADIEKRRKEELDKVSKSSKISVVDEIKREIGSLKGEQANVLTENTRKIVNAYRKIFGYPPFTGDINDYLKALREAEPYYANDIRLNSLDLSAKFVIELAEKIRGNEKNESAKIIEEINAKYDAELAALGKGDTDTKADREKEIKEFIRNVKYADGKKPYDDPNVQDTLEISESSRNVANALSKNQPLTFEFLKNNIGALFTTNSNNVIKVSENKFTNTIELIEEGTVRRITIDKNDNVSYDFEDKGKQIVLQKARPISFAEAKFQSKVKEINAKYDALEQKPAETPTPTEAPAAPDIEAKKADIERRRKEALFGNLTSFEFETVDAKGRTRKTTIKTKVDENSFKYSFETTVDGKSSSTAHPKVTKQEFKNSSIYKNLDQDSKDFIDELPEDAIILLQSVAISTDKNSATGLGNGNITIGYVSKEEGGRVDDIGLKYQPNEINAKYDAELAREIYRELKLGKGRTSITQLTAEEQIIFNKYVTKEVIDSVDAELAGLKAEFAQVTIDTLKQIEGVILKNYDITGVVDRVKDAKEIADAYSWVFESFPKDIIKEFSEGDIKSRDILLSQLRSLIRQREGAAAAPSSKPPAPPSSGIDLSSLNEELPFRLVGEVGKEVERMSDAEIEYFKEFVKKNLPGIPYEFIENLVRVNGGDEQAWGVFEDGVAKIYKRAAKGTAFHEIMEGVWLGFLSPDEQMALLDEMRSKKGTFLDRASGRTIEYSEGTNLQLKERIMDDFAEYMDGKIPARSVTQRILQFFKAIVEFFKRWMGNPSLKEKLFMDIRRGKYKRMIFSEDKKRSPTQYKAIEGLSEKQVNDFVQDMSARLFLEIFKNNESLFDIVDSVNKLDIFGTIKEKYKSAGVFKIISEETYPQLVARTKDFLTKFNIEFDEENVLNENDVNRTKDGYAADTFSVNVKKSSPYAVKLLLASLTRMKKESGPMNILSKMPSFDTSYSSLEGGLSLVPFGSTFSALINKLSNVRDVPTFINKLHELATENSDYVYLYKVLGGDMSASSPRMNFEKFKAHNWRLFVSFYQVFTKQKPEGFIQFIDDKEVYTGSANQASLVKQIAEEWKENMKLLSEDPAAIVKFDFQKGLYKVDKSSDKWKSANISSPQGMVSFLSDIGIDFPLEAYNRIKSSDLKRFADAVSGIKTALNKSDVLMTVKAKDFDMRGHVETLSSLYVSATSPVEDSTFFNNKGERQQSFTEANYLSYFEHIINSVESLTELKTLMPQLNDVFSTSSIFLKPGGVLFDEDGYRRRNVPVKVQYILGDKNKNNNTGKSVSDLTIGKRTTLEINQNIKGSYYVVVGGDSKTEWMLNLGNQITLDQVVKGEAYEKINTIFYDYLKDEITLARDAAERRKIKNIGNKAKELRFFKGIFSEKLVEDITRELIEKENVTDQDISDFINKEENKTRIDGDIKSTIEEIAKKQENILRDNNEIIRTSKKDVFKYAGLDKSVKSLGMNKFNLTEKNLSDLMTFVTVNHMISQIEYHKMLFGDPYQFKIKYDEKGKKVIIDETKRIKSFESPRKITVSFPELNNWMNDALNTVDGDISLTKDDIGFHLHKEFAKTFTMRDSIVFSPIASNFEAYEKVDQADASSWLNPATYREIKFKNGQWDNKGERFFQWEMAYARKKLSDKGRYSYPKGERGKRLMEHDEMLLKSKSPKYFIEVIKPVATGGKYAQNNINLVLDKTSQVPLFYRAVEGTNLEELFMKFFEEEYDYAIVESGRKVGIEDVYDFYNPDGSVNTTPIGKSIDVPWEAFGIQVENSYGKPKLQTRGSQLTKLSTVDLYSNGEAIGETPERKEVIKNAVGRNKKVLDELTKNGYESLLKKLSIKDLGSSFEVEDKKKLHSLLKKELLNVSMSDNTIDSIGLNPETGEFEIPFEASVNYKRIKDVLYSIVDTSLTSPKMNGFSAVQVSAAMWESSEKGMELVEMMKSKDGKISYKKVSREEFASMDDERKKNIRFTNNTLKFYENEDGKRYCEIMVPNWFRKKLGRDMTKEEFTEFANTPEGRKALTGIGFRIPTQAVNSVEVFVVKGFLPDFMGRTVVVPSEITTKAGSDFDIDKLNLYLKNIYVTPIGEIKEVPFFGFGEEAKKAMAKFILDEEIKAIEFFEEDVTGEPKEEDFESMAEMLYKESLENEYYNSLVELLTLPENFNRLVAPNTSKPLEDIADNLSSLRNEVEDVNPMRTMIDRTQLTDLRHTFVMAKNWVGRVATNITAHSLFQKTQMYVKPANFRMSLPHNTITVGNEDHVSFSSLKDVNGEKYISDVLSMFANSFVDVVKDPYIMKIIYSDRLVSTFMMLTRAGVPIDTISYFMNQPIIREYVKKLDADGVSPFTLYSKKALAIAMRRFPANKMAIDQGVLDASNQSLTNNIKKFYSGEKLSAAENVQQQLALKEFMSYFDLSSDLFKITTAINYDTTTFRNADDINRKHVLGDIAKEENIICCPNRVMESSFMGEIQKHLDRSSFALGSILKFNTPEFRSIIDDVMQEYMENPYLSKDKFNKIAEKMSASFLDYIIQVRYPLAIKSLVVDANSVANRVEEARKKHPEVTILKDLVLVSSDAPGGAKTLKLRVNTKDAYDEDLYVGYMREMRDNPATRDLYEDVLKLGIIQGTYYSSVSIKNIIPVEDYARIVAPIMSTLEINDDILAFKKNKMFQRNLFKDDTIAARVTPKFFTAENENESEEDFIIGVDSDEVEIYQYSTKDFPEIKGLGVADKGTRQRTIFKMSPRAKGATHSVITIPRILNIGGERVDFVTGQTVTNSFYSERKAKGDRTIYDVYGYKRVEELDGTPFLTEDGYYIYKQINLVGDGQLATEYSVFPKQSVINNNTVKVEMEIPDEDIIRYFVEQVPVQQPIVYEREKIGFTESNTIKIVTGKKTSTIRSDREASEIGIPVGKTEKVKIGGSEFNVTNRGKLSVQAAGGAEAMVVSEGLPTAPDEKNKYEIDVNGVKYYTMFPEVASWFKGIGQNFYVYNIQPVSPAEQQPEKKEEEETKPPVPAPKGPVETGASVKETGKYVTYKGETYIVTKMNDNGTVQIYNPLKEGPSAKLSVSPSNLKALQPKASIVSYQGDEYIVTTKNTIISLKTNKMMKWAENDGKRKAILQVANAERVKILTFENAFSEERRKEILNNFVNKHKVTEEMALKNIKDGIAREGQAAIDLINKCY